MTSTPPTTSYTYDHNGNTLTSVTGSNTTTYAWDFENRLTSVTLPGTGGTVNFKYDPFGRRIEKTTSSTTSIYAYDADNLIEEANASGAVVARYSQGEYVDEPLAMLRSSTTSYYQVDGLGSTTSLSNTSGALANTYSYDSFGNLTASTGSLVNPFRFTARDFDAETNLQFSRNRYYDASSGRFLSEDPIGFGGGSMNFYSYVLNSPTNFIDPSGWRPGDKYPNAKCAGWNAVNDYNPTSVAQNKEYGGFIYQNPDGTFSYTDPHVNKDAGIGNDNSIPRFWQIPIPPGTQRGGWYHTHAGGPMSPINSDFSPQDMDISDKSLHGLPGFLGVPNGQVRMYIPNPGNPEHGISFPLSSKNCGCQK